MFNRAAAGNIGITAAACAFAGGSMVGVAGSTVGGVLGLLLADRVSASIASSAEEDVMSDRGCHGRFFSCQGRRDPSISDPGLNSRRTVVLSSGLIANSRNAGILIIQLRCNSLCRAPERWPARPVYFPARRVGAPVRMAAAAERRIRVASTWPGMARRTAAAAAAASLPEGMGSAMSTRPRRR